MASSTVASLLAAVSLLVVASPAMNGGVRAQPLVAAVISFGDSTIDVGNNNYLPRAVFKADYAPYGVNFAGRQATGRPVLRRQDRHRHHRSDTRLRGVRAAVPQPGGVGEEPPHWRQLRLGGVQLPRRHGGHDAITLTQQLKYYKEYRSKLAAVAGRANASSILSDALYVVSTGTGDFLQNYYHNASLSRRYDVDKYCDLLVGVFSNFATELYKLGARRIGVTSMPPLGCLPASIRLYGEGGGAGACVARLNRDAETFNGKLNSTVKALKRRHAGLKIAIFDIYTPLRQLADAPAEQGFADARGTCCRTGTEKTRVYLCNPTTAGTCRNASSYVFFDGVHPSEAANLFMAESMIEAGIELVT